MTTSITGENGAASAPPLSNQPKPTKNDDVPDRPFGHAIAPAFSGSAHAAN